MLCGLIQGVECGDLPIMASSNRTVPRVAVLSREVGGRASFSCKLGYGIRGPAESICLPSGEWSTPFPTCVGKRAPERPLPIMSTRIPSQVNRKETHFSEVQCENPGAPANGYAQGSAPYRAGDVVQFNCNPEYMMQGQPIIACQDNGRWSGGLPKCECSCAHTIWFLCCLMFRVRFCRCPSMLVSRHRDCRSNVLC